VHAGRIGAMGCISHQTIENGPDWPKGLGWWAEGRLLKCHIALLCIRRCVEVSRYRKTPVQDQGSTRGRSSQADTYAGS
jgi:hypothetical protein